LIISKLGIIFVPIFRQAQYQCISEEETRLAITQIIARAACPASEVEPDRWIRENSAVCDLTRYPIEKITKDKRYKSSLKLFANKEKIENFLSLKKNQLFDIEDKIYIYDLTKRIMNTQKAVTTVSQKRYDQVIISIRTSDPTPKVQDIYDRLHYKSRPTPNENL
jgi:hypothetical protein